MITFPAGVVSFSSPSLEGANGTLNRSTPNHPNTTHTNALNKMITTEYFKKEIKNPWKSLAFIAENTAVPVIRALPQLPPFFAAICLKRRKFFNFVKYQLTLRGLRV